MIRLLLILGTLTLVAPSSLAQEAAEAVPRLTAELLVAHPSLVDGDVATHREDVLRALEANPRSPLARTAARLLWNLEADGETETTTDESIARLLRLAEAVDDADASLGLRRAVRRAASRRRFSDQPVDGSGDAFPEFIDRWHVVGPLGPLHAGAPALLPAPAASPEAEDANSGMRLEASYAAADGNARRWISLSRGRNRTSIRPSERVFPAGGLTYALAFVDVPADALEDGVAQLELRTSGAVRAWWNGVSCIDERRLTSFDNDQRFRVRVPVQPGWNALLVRTPTSDRSSIAARILDGNGLALAHTQPETDDPTSVAWSIGSACEPVLDPWRAEQAAAEGPFDPALRMLRYRFSDRSDLALTVDPPAADQGPRALAAWRLERLRALVDVGHLPEDLRRQRLAELLDQIEADGPFFSFARERQVRRLLSEDRPREAMTVTDQWAAACPDRAWPRYFRAFVLGRIDSMGILRREALRELVQDYPAHRGARAELASLAMDAGSESAAIQAAWDALTGSAAAPDGSNDDLLDLLLESLWPVDVEYAEILRTRAGAWAQTVPESESGRQLVRRIARSVAPRDVYIAQLREAAERTPEHAAAHAQLADALFAAEQPDAAMASLQTALRLRPSDGRVRDLLARAGVPDPVEQFFAEFAADEGAALQRAEGVTGTSVVEALDAGMIYYFPDGSSHTRSHTMSIPLDREGTESLHALPIGDDTQTIRILTKTGDILEPVAVNGEWVLPSFEPGDVVDQVWDSRAGSVHGAPPAFTSWRFASFERAFPTSRWVVFVPDGLDGQFAIHDFDGTHEEVPWKGGTAHILTASTERLVEEVLRPSYAEILPGASFGGPGDRSLELASWREYVAGQVAIPADLEAELQAFADEHATGATNYERARSLYLALEARTRTYEGDEDAASAWQQERGWPLFLLAALFDRAQIPFTWAVLESLISPELDPDPVQPFEDLRPLAQVALRLDCVDAAGDPVWVLPTSAPGTPFGALSAGLVGAGAYVLHGDGSVQRDTVPRTQATASWDLSISIEFEVQEDGSAKVTGQLVDASPQGQVGIRQIRELPAQQRESIARQQAGQLVQGTDIRSAAVVLDGAAEDGIVIRFEGVHPTFATSGLTKIPFLAMGLSRRFGPAERQWDLAVRQAMRLEVEIQVDPGEYWTLGDGPRSITEDRPGFEVELSAEDVSGPEGRTTRRYGQRIEQRGFLLPSDQMPAFLTRMGKIDAEFDRPLQLKRSPR